MKEIQSKRGLIIPICAVITAFCVFSNWVTMKVNVIFYSSSESYSLRELHELLDTVATSLQSIGIKIEQLDSIANASALFWILSWGILLLEVGAVISYISDPDSSGTIQRVAGGLAAGTALYFYYIVIKIGNSIAELVGSSEAISISPSPVVLIVLVSGIIEFCIAPPRKKTRSLQEIIDSCIEKICNFFKELVEALPILVFGVVAGGILIYAGGNAVLIFAALQYPAIYIIQKIAH